jgi:hypothetical protein
LGLLEDKEPDNWAMIDFAQKHMGEKFEVRKMIKVKPIKTETDGFIQFTKNSY